MIVVRGQRREARAYLETLTVLEDDPSLGDDGAVTEDDRDTAVIHRLSGENYRGPDPACKAVENSAVLG